MEDNPKPNDIPFKNISGGSSSAGFVKKLILFLEEQLPIFSTQGRVSAENNEDFITDQLCQFLNRIVMMKTYSFYFHHQKYQVQKKGQKRSVDFAGILNTEDVDSEVIFCIEAKKLPTPGSGREREYVLGNGGGIERFKIGAHGLDNAGNLVEHNGIIGYVTNYKFKHWLAQINQWISEAGWDDSEKLAASYFSTTAKLISSHSRTSGETVNLSHFWVNI